MKIEYLIRGTGQKTFVCFHGHGHNMHYWEFLADHFEDSRVVSFNIFQHGKSELIEDDLHHANLAELFQLIFEKEQIHDFISVGYSLGGKFALNLVNYFPTKVYKVILVAAEGIRPNNFYNLSSRILIMRKLYKLAIEKPGWIFRPAKFLERIGVFSPSLMKFIELQMGEQEKRQMVYNTWAKFRFIFPNQGRLKKNIQEQNINLFLIIGSKDRICKPETGRSFIKKIGVGEFREISTSHDVFRKDYLENLLKELKDIV